MNQVRIGGGEMRSRIITFPDAEGLRPTPDRVRETLFNWLGQTLYGRSCLDLFAGRRRAGFRGRLARRERVVMVERNRHSFPRPARRMSGTGLRECFRHAQDALEFASRGRAAL